MWQGRDCLARQAGRAKARGGTAGGCRLPVQTGLGLGLVWSGLMPLSKSSRSRAQAIPIPTACHPSTETNTYRRLSKTRNSE